MFVADGGTDIVGEGGNEQEKGGLKRQSRQAAALQGEVYHQIGKDSAEADKSERRD